MESQNDILMMYLRVSQHLSRLFRCHLEKLQLTFPQALVLNVLGQEGPLPISVLAERTGSANSTVSGIVDRLERLGLAQRERSGRDRRVVYVAATEKYLLLRGQADADIWDYFSSILDSMDGGERRMVAEALLCLDRALLKKESEHAGTEAGEAGCSGPCGKHG